MARIMITYPETGRPVYTHLSTEWSNFDRMELADQSVQCPKCHKVHSWSQANAYLDEEGGD